MNVLLSADMEFWSRVDVRDARDCWRWLGALTTADYGVFCSEGEQIVAHRYAWSFAYGAIPTGMMILHSCDTGWCVNPRHLRVGTHEDNNADRSVITRVGEVLAEIKQIEQNRRDVAASVIGNIPPTMPQEFGVAIRRIRLAAGMTQKQFADRLGVTGAAVCQWEKGTCGVSLARLNSIAETMGIDVKDLVS